jgi:cell division protein FtsB
MDRRDRQSISQKSLMIRAGTVVFGLLTLGMMVLTLVSDRGLLEVRRKAERLAGLESQIAQLEIENAALIEEIQTLRTDPGEIERRAREDLQMVRPGEVILVVPSPPE